MKTCLLLILLFFSLQITAQDTTMASLTQDMETKTTNEKKPVKIFDSEKTINARTTEVAGKGKMNFNVTHNFGDIGGSNGGIENFFGLDNAADIRIGFHIGVGHRTDLIVARAKGASLVRNLWEFGIKHQLLRQMENDPSHPVSLAFYFNTVISSQKRNPLNNQDNSFDNFGDRASNIFQLILARKMGKVSLQLNPVFFTRGHAISYDQKNMFALGGAIRLPLGGRVNLVVDYFHPFRKEAVEDSFRVNDNIKFYNPLGVGVEVITGGHIFHLNFTNATEILENRFLPRTTTSWGKGQFRWGFTIARTFSLWREKDK
jgi:hypothetical protein